MATVNTEHLPPDQLASMLRAWASGLYSGEAAVELLIAHGAWLARRDFRVGLVDAVDDGWGRRGAVVPMAAIGWDVVADFLDQPEVGASTSEVSILRLAASLAGARGPTSLMELTGTLDDTNAALVLDALAHRFGWHESGTTHLVTGYVGTQHPRRTT